MYLNLPPEESTILDAPYNFGLECNWLALPTSETERIVDLLQLNDVVPCNWKHGVIWGHHQKIFVSPPVRGWSFVISSSLPFADGERGVMRIKNILTEFSKEFGEAQYFGSLGSVDYDCWFKAENGDILRAYCFADGQNIIVEGKPTPVEKNYKLVNTFSEACKNDPDYLLREDIDFPRQTITMEVAASWSLNPQELPRNEIAPRLGLLGERKWK